MRYGTPIRIYYKLRNKNRISDCTACFRREISDKLMFYGGRISHVLREQLIKVEVLT